MEGRPKVLYPSTRSEQVDPVRDIRVPGITSRKQNNLAETAVDPAIGRISNDSGGITGPRNNGPPGLRRLQDV